MAGNSLHQVHNLGQSIWFDNIQRHMLLNGEFQQMIRNGEIWGVTSNPSIFEHAITHSNDYDDALTTLVRAGWNARDIFWQLAIEDIRAAADLFMPVYRATKQLDGYVSLEVDPTLAHDTGKTVAEAQRLWKRVNRPNLMIKIPATLAGLAAIRKVIALGINVNVTLIFSLKRYREVIDAYISGLEDRLRKGESLGHIRSVASFFVSRMDSKVDKKLTEISSGKEAKEANKLLGKSAIANAKLAYQIFLDSVQAERFQYLRQHGANTQRPLWASTSTKNPDYRDVMYVEQLIGKETINTVPPQTLQAFRAHGKAKNTILTSLAEANLLLDAIEAQGISIKKVTDELEAEGVSAFISAYNKLLDSIEERRAQAVKELGRAFSWISRTIKQFDRSNPAEWLWEGRAERWTKDKAGQVEFKKRLGWLDAPIKSITELDEILKFIEDQRRQKITKVLVLGMGGSSLAPEVFSLFAKQDTTKLNRKGMQLRILDSTDPQEVLNAQKFAQMERTLFVISSKSGTTSEVNAFLDFFWEKAVRKFGKMAGRHFIAITDPGTVLARLAKERKFIKVFLADASVGGRYSALTHFGLIPAGLVGLDLPRLLRSARQMRDQCLPEVPTGRNPGLVLGAILGNAAKRGINKLTFIADAPAASFGSWLEQLIAESSGKLGRGILPVDLEPHTMPINYGKDRIFVHLRMNGEQDAYVKKLRAAGCIVITQPILDPYNLGAEMYRWEMATAVSCQILKVNPFDQPDVQLSKTITEQKIREYKGKMGEADDRSMLEADGIGISGNLIADRAQKISMNEIRRAIIKHARSGTFIAINAYVSRDEKNALILQTFRKKILDDTRCAVTLGFGPRFQHSTGQYHKGGLNQGIFIQIVQSEKADVIIPGQGLTFNMLKHAQAQGDYEALLKKGRKVIRLSLGQIPLEKLLKLWK